MTDDEKMPPDLEQQLRAILDAFEIPGDLRREWKAVGFPDEIDRRRHPQVGCYEHDSGTWIHGRPHTCPKWTRR